MVMDADLQHDESKILEMMKIQKKYNLDIVVASRFLVKNYTSCLIKKKKYFITSGKLACK